MTGLAHRGFGLTEHGRQAHLARFLRDHGYETVQGGIQHEIAHGREADIGYQRVLSHFRNANRRCTTPAVPKPKGAVVNLVTSLSPKERPQA